MATVRKNSKIRGRGLAVLFASGLMGVAAGSTSAQQEMAREAASATQPAKQERQKPDVPAGTELPGTANAKKRGPAREHAFWDKENDWLFAGVGASRTLDYFSTLNMRRRGRQEIFLTNDVVDNHAAFAVIEASATGVSIGAAYLFHRYGHHKLERWTSIIHIGLATTGSVRNYCLKTAHFQVTPGSP